METWFETVSLNATIDMWFEPVFQQLSNLTKTHRKQLFKKMNTEAAWIGTFIIQYSF